MPFLKAALKLTLLPLGVSAARIANFADQVHLSFLLFLHRLAEEARINAFENKSKIIKPEHTIAAAKVILKKSRG
ncbi:PREDICTED: centromere protein W [Tauraco erythrolophus]|uniref:centromere protein W n=1 Tax=Tauraco erythrolophus TaxID=121530 RepID=UPI000523C052|nr:PREDICTED: centromere protein W [Tauraco erythrolophus]